MPYERSRKIEQRFQEAISLLKTKHLDAGQLATELGVSRPTAQRIVSELRRRGNKIRSIREEHGWRYELLITPDSEKSIQYRNKHE